MTSNITISKGVYSVTIKTIEISDDHSNQIRPIILPQVKQKQETGAKTNKVIDMLKISHTIQVRGVLTSTTDRNNLLLIFEGAGVQGSPCSIAYDTYPNSPLSMFMEKLIITEKAIDKSTNNPHKYEVQVTLFEGEIA